MTLDWKMKLFKIKVLYSGSLLPRQLANYQFVRVILEIVCCCPSTLAQESQNHIGCSDLVSRLVVHPSFHYNVRKKLDADRCESIRRDDVVLRHWGISLLAQY